MLLECDYCGAPLDVKDGERLTKCKYCGTTSRSKKLKTVAAQTPEGWTPPVEWRPPSHVAADSAKSLAYHASWAARQVIRRMIALAMMGVILVFVVPVFLMARRSGATSVPELVRNFTNGSDPQGRNALEAAKAALSNATQQAKNLAHVASAPTQDLTESSAATTLVKQFEQQLGSPVNALQLVLHPTHGSLQAQDPKKPKNVDRYTYRMGVIGSPEPVRTRHLRGSLEDHLFDLNDVALDQLTDLKKTTLEKLAYEDGEISHVIVQRNIPFGKNVVIRVYARGPRDSGRIDFTADGKVQRIFE